jgi:hypothetical protein
LSCYDLYFEIPTNNVDIVAKNGSILMAYEVKVHLNFKVIEQAYMNSHYFHFSYICVPNAKNIGFQLEVCKKFGVGVLVWDRYDKVTERQKPLFNRKAITKYIKLPEYSKRSIPGASGNNGTTITPFKSTIENMVKYIRRHPECSLKECIENTQHHYYSSSAAKTAIYKWMANGVIDEFYLNNNKLYLNQSEGKNI